MALTLRNQGTKIFLMYLTDSEKTSSSPASLPIDYSVIKKAARMLRSVNHPLRRQILDLLNENGKLTVTDLFMKLQLEQSVASQHLAILRESGVVATERQGKYIFYSANINRLEQIQENASRLC
jgi:DNA-binding transcriptional ArsR family regulator